MILKTFPNGTIEFRHGKFDKWAVIFNTGTKILWPKDTEYFQFLKNMANIYGDKVYKDFVEIYEKTTKDVDGNLVRRITEISKDYGKFSLQMDIVLSVIYFAMIAEENKAHSILGKRIKRLGLYKILVENGDVYHSANFMRGVKWRELDAMCKGYGF